MKKILIETIKELIPYDKALHDYIATWIACICLLFYPLVGLWAIPITIVICSLFFFLKELTDEKFSWGDIAFGYIGMLKLLTPALIIMLMQ